MPGLSTIPDAMLVAICSPVSQGGLLYEKWKAHFGKDSDDVLVIQATSRHAQPDARPSLVERRWRTIRLRLGRSGWASGAMIIASYVDIEMDRELALIAG